MRRREFGLKLLGLCFGSLALGCFATTLQRRGKKMESRGLPRLKVFDNPKHPNNRRYIVTETGEPFFYLGDTAWELFH